MKANLPILNNNRRGLISFCRKIAGAVAMKNGYENMSDRGKAIAEYIELVARHVCLKLREKIIPGFKVPNELIKDLGERFSKFGEDEKSAVVDLLSTGPKPRWEHWLKTHLLSNPEDAPQLFMVERTFGGASSSSRSISTFVYENYGVSDYPWQMEHRW